MNQFTHTKIFKLTNCKLIVGLLLFVCLPFSVLAQKNFLDYELKISIENGDIDNVKISITKNGNPFRTIDSKKKYDLKLDLGMEYVITATKLGYITKSIVVDTRVPDGRDEEEFRPFESEIILKPQPEEEEITYTQPVGRIKYSNDTGDFDYDKDYSAKSQEMQKKADANPKKRPKEKNDSITSKSKVIEKKVEKKVESNPQKVVEKQASLTVDPVIRTVVERIVQQDKLKITYRNITINGVEIVYRKEEFSWGGVYFYKGVKNISESTYDKDTK